MIMIIHELRVGKCRYYKFICFFSLSLFSLLNFYNYLFYTLINISSLLSVMLQLIVLGFYIIDISISISIIIATMITFKL
ncbi:hypothetical protein DFH27DRAFT_537175 [Peziza echinospora]|nr:hypothetical protein DFH27DRAFT_537175 [Peziza echinospora]